FMLALPDTLPAASVAAAANPAANNKYRRWVAPFPNRRHPQHPPQTAYRAENNKTRRPDAAAGRNPAVADATADRAPVCKSTPADRSGVPAWSAAWPRGGNPAGGYPDGWIYSRPRNSDRCGQKSYR